MRSLQEWMKYLEQQEQSLQEAEQEPSQAGDRMPAKETEEPSFEPDGAGVVVPEKASKTEAPPEPQPWNPPRVIERPAVKRAAPATRRAKRKAASRTAGDTGRSEVAQTSYKPFRETREDLLHRLLDPLISLEEAARLLNVCPTTVRRYTNRGVLKHQRTAGNQRRFRLSDVLTFMESGGTRL